MERLLGIAMGCMGISMDDFCRCTPSEFYAVWQAWDDSQKQTERNMWERARMQALCTLQPYSQKKLQASDIMQFPWDKEESEPLSSRGREKNLSHEEIMERYRKARERAGLS